MSTLDLSVVGGYRGRMEYNTKGDCWDRGGYWDPLIRVSGPKHVFIEAKIDTDLKKLKENRNRHTNKCTTRRNSKENESDDEIHDNNDNNEDQKKDERRNKDRRSYRTISRQQ